MLSAKNEVYPSKQQNTLPSPPTYQHTMTTEQQKYCIAIIRNLKRHRDAAPFLKPVDHVKLNVPDYPIIITQPMDLQLVEKKLTSSEYTTVDDFIADVRLIFSNCFKYNGPESMISVLCQNLESAFEKGLRQMPPSSIPNTPKASTPKAVPSSPVKKEPSPPLSQHNSPPPPTNPSEESARPKREIHCPSKDYPETFTAQKKLNNNSPMKYCLQALKELKKAKYRQLAYPFLEPVDPVAMNLPDYNTIVQTPMDLSTIEAKLLNQEYDDPEAFESDMSLMFNNCYLYNPPTLPIYTMAKDLEKIFRAKWAQKPAEHRRVAQKRPSQPQPAGTQKRHSVDIDHAEEDVDEEDLVDDSDDKIAALERSIKNIAEQIEYIKSSKKSTTSTTTAPKRRGRGPNKNPTKKRKAAAAAAATNTTSKHNDDSSDDDEDDYEFTFDQKKRLSEAINNLAGDDLNIVVEIIQTSMPHLGGDGQGEIVLDIDALNKDTLRKLSEFVTPKSAVKNKRYTAKERRIHQLEKTLEKFNQVKTRPNSSSSESDSGDDNGGSSSDSSTSDSD